MKWQNSLGELIEHACPSIQYRIRRDILKEPASTDLEHLYHKVIDDPQVQYAFSLQRNDGYWGDVFHAGFLPTGKYKEKIGFEAVLHFLLEKGIETDNPRIKAGMESLKRDKWLGQDKGIWCVYYKEIGLYGPEFIRMVAYAMTNVAPDDDLRPFVQDTVRTFKDILPISSLNDITEDFRHSGKLYKVYKKGIRFPETYHLKLLAYTELWRKNEADRNVIENGIKKLIDLSPLQDVKVKYKSRWLAPGGIRPYRLDTDLIDLATVGWDGDNWGRWFRTFELLAKMGIVKEIEALHRQAKQLMALLDRGKGYFPIDLPFEYFSKLGLALERDWKQGRGKYDLAFRSLLILSLSGILE